MILLDTHVLVWLAEDSAELGRRASRSTDVALGHDEVFVAAISFWEIAMLAAKGRLRLEITPAATRHRGHAGDGSRIDTDLEGPARKARRAPVRALPWPLSLCRRPGSEVT